MIQIIFLSLFTFPLRALLHKPWFCLSFISHKSEDIHTVRSSLLPSIVQAGELFFSQTIKYDESIMKFSCTAFPQTGVLKERISLYVQMFSPIPF